MRVKDAVAVLNGWPHQYTMARFVEEAFAAHLERLKLDFNGGRGFPVTNRKIRTGRHRGPDISTAVAEALRLAQRLPHP